MKVIFIVAILAAVAYLTAAVFFRRKKEEKGEDDIQEEDGSPTISASVESIIAAARQSMYCIAEGRDYRYFETDIKLAEFADSESQKGELLEVASVFQVVAAKDKGYDTQVWFIGVGENGAVQKKYEDAFYLENQPLNDEPMPVAFMQALERLQQSNIVKPHSQYVVLRKPVGPVQCNAQWIFGNRKQTAFVDAVTGEVRAYNPAFPKTDTPLTVWP